MSNLQLGMVRYNAIGEHLVKVITELFQFLRRPVTRKSTFFTLPVMALFKFTISPALPSILVQPRHGTYLDFDLFFATRGQSLWVGGSMRREVRLGGDFTRSVCHN